MSSTNWMIVERLKRLGWAAHIGLALSMFALVFQFAVNAPLQARVQQLQQEAAAAKNNAENAAHTRKRSEIRPVSARLNEFYQYFPDTQSMPDLLGIIYATAAEQGIQLPQGEYKLVTGKAGKLAGYQISLPVRGSYAQVRMFVIQVLNDVPAASLDELSFTREAIGNADVEAKIRLTLYLRAG